MGGLEVELSQCTGCRMCEIWCSITHEGVVNPAKSRIRVMLVGLPEEPVPVYCIQCKKAACAETCPTGAIQFDQFIGAWVVDENNCNGCGECVKACPFGAIFLHPESGKAVKCDLCRGEPECVKYCVRGFLKYSKMEKQKERNLTDEVNQKRFKYARRQLARVRSTATK